MAKTLFVASLRGMRSKELFARIISRNAGFKNISTN